MSRLPPVRAALVALAFACFALVFATASASAQQISSSELDKNLSQLESKLGTVEKQVDTVPDEQLPSLRRALDEVRAIAAQMTTTVKPEVSNIREWIDALGPPPSEGPEPPRIAGERKGLSQRLLNLDSAVRRAELLISKTSTLSSRVLNESRERFSQRILARGPSLLEPQAFFDATREMTGIGLSVVPDALGFVTRADVWTTLGTGPIYIVGLVLLVLAAAFVPLRRLQREVISTASRPDMSTDLKAWRALKEIVARSIVPLLLLIALYAALRPLTDLSLQAGDIIDATFAGLVILVMTYAVTRSVLTPHRTNQRLFNLADKSAQRWQIAATAIAGVYLLELLRGAVLSTYPTSFQVIALSSFVVVTLFAVIFTWALWPRRREPIKAEDPATPPQTDKAPPPAHHWGPLRVSRLFAALVMAATPFMALAGYFALSRYVSSRMILTAVLFAVLWLIYYVLSALFHRQPASAAATLATEERKLKEDRDRLLSWWLSVAAGAVLAVLGVAIAAVLWGASAEEFEALLYKIFYEGFDFGGGKVSLGQVLIALVVFGAGLWLTRLIQAAADRRVLPQLRVEAGARDSIRSALGYLGVFIAALIAIGAAGLDLTNAAIIAGALSVGIGFGLQAIVNNFVSGLILLFERPFKVGDWVVVAGAEGTVRRINVRATEIQTFDNATVIVPNSQFISAPMTNWMHKDSTGRVVIKVPLAHRVDPEKVRDILLACSLNHPDVTSYPPPTVVLRGFAAGLYEFELRTFVRDVRKMSSVRSDLNFTIVKRLHEENLWQPVV